MGAVRGVLLTSVLFAMAHVSPSHAVATLPIAIFLQVVYLATGSLWAPILVHFLNNALSVTMMKYELGREIQVSLVLLVSSAVYVTVVGIMLLRSVHSREPSRLMRTGLLQRHRMITLADGGPAPAAGSVWLMLIAGSSVVCFTLSFVAAAVAAPGS